MALRSGAAGGSTASARAIPTSRKAPWERVTVVFAMTTEASPSPSGTRGRRRYAFTGSPPIDAVGVATLNASPASLTASRVGNGVRSRRNA